jgi:phosphoglycolate phosphatase
MSDGGETCRAISQLSSQRNGFRWMDADAYLFDIDGTLLNTQDLVHYRALNRAMRDVYGFDTTIDGIAYHGKTDLGILRAALERVGVSGNAFQSKLPAALAMVRADVERNAGALVTKVCAAIPDVLLKLHHVGKLLGVASGNLEVVGWHKLESAELRKFFTFGCFADDCEMREEVFRRAVTEAQHRLQRKGTVCFIGDTPSDIRAARQVGAQVIAVATGIYKRITGVWTRCLRVLVRRVAGRRRKLTERFPLSTGTQRYVSFQKSTRGCPDSRVQSIKNVVAKYHCPGSCLDGGSRRCCLRG